MRWTAAIDRQVQIYSKFWSRWSKNQLIRKCKQNVLLYLSYNRTKTNDFQKMSEIILEIWLWNRNNPKEGEKRYSRRSRGICCWFYILSQFLLSFILISWVQNAPKQKYTLRHIVKEVTLTLKIFWDVSDCRTRYRRALDSAKRTQQFL